MRLRARLTPHGWVGFVDGRCVTAPCISFGEALKMAAVKEWRRVAKDVEAALLREAAVEGDE